MEDTRRRLRVLCLHGKGTSAQIMETQLRMTLFQPPLRSELQKPLALSYLDGTHRMRDDELKDPGVKLYFPHMPYYMWFDSFLNDDGKIIYVGFEEALKRVIDFCKEEGPFDGVLGFSQGGVMVQILLAMQRDGSIPTSFQFGILMGIGKCAGADFQYLFNEKIPYPALILFNVDDPVVSNMNYLEARTQELTNMFSDATVIRNPEGGHAPPRIEKGDIETFRSWCARFEPQANL